MLPSHYPQIDAQEPFVLKAERLRNDPEAGGGKVSASKRKAIQVLCFESPRSSL